jgi:hypothetical protein
MLLHDGYKVGKHWEHTTGHEQKETCNHCEVRDSMQHILTQCDVPGQEIVWDLASELWRMKIGEDLRPALGQIMACGIISKKD